MVVIAIILFRIGMEVDEGKGGDVASDGYQCAKIGLSRVFR